jgi:hypothetical protein
MGSELAVKVASSNYYEIIASVGSTSGENLHRQVSEFFSVL